MARYTGASLNKARIKLINNRSCMSMMFLLLLDKQNPIDADADV
jgi:hypothetical protein